MMDYAPVLLIIGFVLFLVGGLAAPPKVYQQDDVSAQLEIIARFPSRWDLSNYLGAAGGLVISLGFVALLLGLDRTPTSLTWMGIFLFAFSAGALMVQSIRRAISPDIWLATVGYLEYVWLYSFMAGLMIIGFILFRMDFPRWLSLGTIVTAGVLAGASLIFNLVIGEISYLLPLVLGIYLLLN